MYYVYILRSKNFPNQTYIGPTSNLRNRLAEHYAGKSIQSDKFKPWNLIVYIALPEQGLAENLERYLKSESGWSFGT